MKFETLCPAGIGRMCGTTVRLAVRLSSRRGKRVDNLRVRWSGLAAGGTFLHADTRTDSHGVAWNTVHLVCEEEAVHRDIVAHVEGGYVHPVGTFIVPAATDDFIEPLVMFVSGRSQRNERMEIAVDAAMPVQPADPPPPGEVEITYPP